MPAHLAYALMCAASAAAVPPRPLFRSFPPPPPLGRAGNIQIGKGAQIAAGSLVLKDVPPHTMVAGSPAKVVGPVSALGGWGGGRAGGWVVGGVG